MSLPAAVVARTHPRSSTWATQVAVLVVAIALGSLVGLALLAADRASWQDTRPLDATVTGRSDKGVLADTAQGQVVLHLGKVPVTGTRLAVEVSPDGRARPLSYRQTLPSALRSGIGLAVLLGLLVQGYRYAVTRRPLAD